jgi:hypothetical protein
MKKKKRKLLLGRYPVFGPPTETLHAAHFASRPRAASVPLTPWPLLLGHLFTRCASLETRARASARSSPSPTDAPEFTGAGTPGISVRPLLGLGIRLSPGMRHGSVLTHAKSLATVPAVEFLERSAAGCIAVPRRG